MSITAAGRIQHLVGTVVEIKQRWQGEKYDTLVIEIESDDGLSYSLKGKEHKDLATPIIVGGTFAFFGKNGRYKSPSGFSVPQFQFCGYVDSRYINEACELYDMLLGRGFPKELPARLVERFKSNAVRVARLNPYLLLEYSGVGFRRCDGLWLEYKRPVQRLKRQVYYLKDAIESRANGSVWVEADLCASLLAGAVPMATPDPARAVRLGVRAGVLAQEYSNERGWLDSLLGSKKWIASSELAGAERKLAQLIAEAMKEDRRWIAPEQGKMSDHQFRQLLNAIEKNCGCLIGGGGTGKTFTTAQLAIALQKQRRRILAVAPTGKAAVRMTEAFAEYNVNVRGITIHSALFRGGFNDADAILVDESSMIDLQLMAALMESRPKGTPILFIGDAQQLPPVGPGAPFRDMLSILPVGELTQIRRNAGAIAVAGGAIRNGVAWNCEPLSGDYIDKMENNLQQFSSKATLQHVVEAWHYARSVNPEWTTDDIQILGVVRQRSETSVADINAAIQKEIYGDVDSRRFQLQDKVICTSNSWLIASRGYGNDLDAMRNKSGQLYVANGEIGRVADVNAKRYVVHFPNPNRYVDVYYENVHENSDEGMTGCDLQLAYAITTHKCVTHDTLIETDSGVMEIGESVSGVVSDRDDVCEFARSSDNEPMECVDVVCEGGFGFTATKYHGVEVIRNGVSVRVQAGEITEGDWMRLAVGARIEPKANPKIDIHVDSDSRAVRYRTPTKISNDLAELFGLIVADGTVFKNGFRLVKRHRDVVVRFAELCETIFGIKTTVVPHRSSSAWECTVNSAYLAEWIRQIGGMLPHSKHAPKIVLRSHSSIQKSFLRGLFEDGCVNVKNGVVDHIQFTNHGERRVLRAVQYMLLRSGIVGSIERQSIYIYGNECAKFRDLIGFVSERKNNQLMTTRITNKRSRIPVGASDTKLITNQSIRFFAQKNGYVSRDAANCYLPAVAGKAVGWHYVRVTNVECVVQKTTCLSTSSGRFNQNGFPHFNSQGSQFPCTIVVIDSSGGARRMMDRGLIYTMLTRASKLCLVVGSVHHAINACRRVAIDDRKTFLKERF